MHTAEICVRGSRSLCVDIGSGGIFWGVCVCLEQLTSPVSQLHSRLLPQHRPPRPQQRGTAADGDL